MERDHLEHLGIDGRTLQWIRKKIKWDNAECIHGAQDRD
jgi:hypothetical protein